jgi:hypothetical protein
MEMTGWEMMGVGFLKLPLVTELQTFTSRGDQGKTMLKPDYCKWGLLAIN